jgi:hypothetical protein
MLNGQIVEWQQQDEVYLYLYLILLLRVADFQMVKQERAPLLIGDLVSIGVTCVMIITAPVPVSKVM